MQQIIVHCGKERTRIALLERGRLIEYFVERSMERQRVGSIYVGRVMNVLPGMQAAFIDIGTERNAFLYIDDLLPAHADKHIKDKPAIDELLKAGQKLLVQVMKEAAGSKGARVTTHCALPGRSLVYMPKANYIGISRKIESELERARLKAVGEEIRLPGEGLIVRTVASGEDHQVLLVELEELRAMWSDLSVMAERREAPYLIYQDLDIIPRIVRDLYTERVQDIVIDAAEGREEILGLLSDLSPQHQCQVQLYTGTATIFDHYGVTDELDLAFKRKIWLNSGAYLVIEQTEALTIIDVNTGKYTGSVNLEQTVFETNLEAAAEVARIIRVRNLSGIIIVDFIDMVKDEHRQRISNVLESLFKQDRIKTLVVGWTKLGLLEVTRKKTREPLDQLFYVPCGQCQGKGKLYHPKEN